MAGKVLCLGFIAGVLGMIVPTTMTFEERWNYLLSFSDTLNGVNVTWSPTSGFGFVLLEDLNQGDCVVKLPLRYSVTSADVYTLSDYITNDFNEMEKLAVRVAYEKFMKKREHYAKQYVDSLPVEPFHMVQYWNPEDFELFERYTLVMLDYDSVRKYNITVLHEKVIKAIGKLPGVPKEMLDEDILEWAMGIVMSRSYHLTDENMKKAVNHPNYPGNILAMFPILDIINHYPIPVQQKSTQPTIFSIEPGLISKLCSLAQFSQKKGHEYFGSYGDKSTYELISMYGFALETNPDDTVEIGLPLTPYCTGNTQVASRCYYATKAHKVSVPVLLDLIASLAHYQFNGQVTFEQIVGHIREMPARKEQRKLSLVALKVYRNVVLMSINQGPLRLLRKLKKDCLNYRCELVHTVLIAQRVARYLHTERVDRRLLELLAQDLDILTPS